MGSLGLPSAAFWVALGSRGFPWVPAGSIWAPFGLPRLPLGSLWAPFLEGKFGSLLLPLAPFGLPRVPFGPLHGTKCQPYGRKLQVKSLARTCPELARTVPRTTARRTQTSKPPSATLPSTVRLQLTTNAQTQKGGGGAPPPGGLQWNYTLLILPVRDFCACVLLCTYATLFRSYAY